MSHNIKLTSSGSIDILYYQRQAEAARAEAIQAFFSATKAKLSALFAASKRSLPLAAPRWTPAH